MGFQTLVDKIIKKAAVSLQEAEEAANVLTKTPKSRLRRYGDIAAIGVTADPLVRGFGRATEAAVLAPRGQKLRAAVKGFTDINKGQVARHVVEGGLGGVGLRAAQEQMEIGRARNKAHEFLKSAAKQIQSRLPVAPVHEETGLYLGDE